MNITTLKQKFLAFSLATIGTMPLGAWATPAATSPYVTDPQNSYVQDATSDGISNLNMVLCIMDSMKPADMVNKGNYIALIDMNKCDSSRSSGGSSSSDSTGASSAPNYMTATVNVTRASNSDPMIGNIWMSMTEEGQSMSIFVHVNATQSPTDNPPYGTFRLDYIGKPASDPTQVMFNGYIDANGADVSYYETGQNSSNNALTLQATSTTSGSGTMKVPDWSTSPPGSQTFNFAYDDSESSFPAGVFRRVKGTTDVCFDRSKANAKKSVWRYGVYDANDGSRVDQANPGFPVQASDGSNTYFGYASYWGVDFQGLDLNSYADGPLSNVTITDQRPNNAETYTLYKNSGKLTKWDQHQATLADMDGIPFSFWGDLTGQTSDSNVTTGNWTMHWDNSQGKFVVTGSENCGNNGCSQTSLTTPATVTGTMFDYSPIGAWSQAFGGNINIPPTQTAHASVDPVYFYSQSDVVPGDSNAPTALYCLNNCPTAAAMTNFNGGSATSPYDSTTETQWGQGAVQISYGFGSSGLTEGGSNTVLGTVVTDKTKFSGQYQNGVQSGRLVTTALTHANCPSFVTDTSIVCDDPNPTTYYTWQTGPNQWNQSMWLVKGSDSSVVSFDPPQNVSYTVPAGAEYGSYAGKTVQLQFNGFGNLNGIPGHCVNPTDNSEVDCGPNTRYVPAFALPDGAAMTLSGTNNGSIPVVVKALDSEVRLSKIASCTGVSLASPAANLTLPDSTGLHDPSDASDADYVGTKPTVTDAPKVIDGVIQ